MAGTEGQDRVAWSVPEDGVYWLREDPGDGRHRRTYWARGRPVLVLTVDADESGRWHVQCAWEVSEERWAEHRVQAWGREAAMAICDGMAAAVQAICQATHVAMAQAEPPPGRAV